MPPWLTVPLTATFVEDPATTTPSPVIAPTDISGLNRQVASWAAPSTAINPIAIERLVIADDAMEALAAAARHYGADGRLLVVTDAVYMRRRGADLKDQLRRLVEREIQVQMCVLGEPQAHLDAGIVRARRLVPHLGDCSAVLAAGSGTVTDIVKYARQLHEADTARRLPMISFPTAASVTAYTSTLAVMSVDGVKRTLPARAPDAVICDLQTLAAAPAAMNQAGFGDVLARSVSYGDWFIADQLGMTEGFSDIPLQLLAGAEQAMIASASALQEATLPATRRLTEAVLLAGMAMSVVNQTAPLSGWEHVISHALDLQSAAAGTHGALHGAQVGIGTLLSATAYASAWPQLEVERLLRPVEQHRESARQRIADVFSAFDASGRLTAEVLRDVQKKWDTWDRAAACRQRFVERYRAGDYDAAVAEHLRTPQDIRTALQAAGAPVKLAALDQPISPQQLRAAVSWSHMIRSRLTLGDLLDGCDRLTGQHVDDLISAADVL